MSCFGVLIAAQFKKDQKKHPFFCWRRFECGSWKRPGNQDFSRRFSTNDRLRLQEIWYYHSLDRRFLKKNRDISSDFLLCTMVNHSLGRLFFTFFSSLRKSKKIFFFFSRWWLQLFFEFSPLPTWGHDPIWPAHILQISGKKPPTSVFLRFAKIGGEETYI